MNLVVAEIEKLYSGGLRIASVGIEKRSGGWVALIGVRGVVNLGEGASEDDRITVDLKNLPHGVSVFGWERHPDVSVDIIGSEEQAEAIINEVARVGGSRDCVRFDGDGPTYPHFLTKPSKWF